MTQFFKQSVEETKVTIRRISKKYTKKAERKISRKETRKRETKEMPLSQDTCEALNCVLLLRAQTHNVCVCVSTVKYILSKCISIFVKRNSTRKGNVTKWTHGVAVRSLLFSYF